jgi:threonine dehydratase
VAEVVAVEEDEIRDAMRFLAARHGLVVEGAGAVATAALLSGRVPAAGRTVALVTGRNVDLRTLGVVFADGD